MRPRFRLKKSTALIMGAALSLCMSGGTALAAHGDVSLPNSHFEIDTDANLINDHGGLYIDWEDVTGDGKFAKQDDEPTGSNDDSFKGGTKEDTESPQATTGSIPNNKSDLLQFGVYQESNGGDFLHMYWTRVQDPSGTTLMDFEFNGGSQGTNADGFPIREGGDILIEYKLAQGGINPNLFMYTWLESAADGTCEASNSYPCWGEQIDLSAAGIATGSINSSTADASSVGLGNVDPFTFGEASIDLSAIFPEGECRSFGLAYLKSRSSDSFTAQMKDFIKPADVNISNCADLLIKKKDDAGDGLEGATFTLYHDDGSTPGFYDDDTANVPDSLTNPVLDCTTDALGECQIIDIFAGDYCVVETGVPEGHEPADPQCITINADANQTLEFTNDRIPAIVNILKKDDAGAFLEGAQFTLYNDVDESVTFSDPPDTSTGKSCTTDGNGECSIIDILPPGDYCVVETVTPTGHDTADPQCFELALEQTLDLEFTNDRQPATVNILKKDDAGAFLEGAQFTLYNDVDESVTFSDPPDTSTGKSCTTDGNGECSITGILPPGKYCVVETVTPTGHDTADPQCLTLALNDTILLEFVNDRQPATVNILKKDDAGAFLEGAQFTLYNDVDESVTFSDPPDTSTGKSCTTNSSGECSITDILPPGKYCVVETVTPTGHDTADPQCITLALNDTVLLEFVNDRQPATVNILKKDDAGAFLEGAQFTLYNDVDESVTFSDPPDTSTGKSCTTDGNGECSITGILPPGKYCVVETVTPVGHDTADPQCITLALNDTVLLEFVNDRQPATVNILKKDDADNVLEGAVFTLYVDNETIGEFGGTDVDTGKSCATGADGQCTISDILPPGNYCVVETTNPNPALYGDADPQCITLALNQTLDLEFINPRLKGSILIKKTRKHRASGSSDPVPHAGVTFTVTGGELLAGINVVTDSDGYACVDNLLLSTLPGVGEYTVTETVPAGYESDDAIKEFSISTADNCAAKLEGGVPDLTFVNTPLTDLTVIVDSLVDGGTQTNVTCYHTPTADYPNPTPTNVNVNGEDLNVPMPNRAPGLYTCEILVDP